MLIDYSDQRVKRLDYPPRAIRALQTQKTALTWFKEAKKPSGIDMSRVRHGVMLVIHCRE